MGITWIDGFDLYAASGVQPDNAGRYTSNVTNHPGVTTGRFGGQALDFKANNGLEFYFGAGLTGGKNTVTIGFAIKFNGSALPADANRRIVWFQNGSTVVATLSVDVDGTVKFYRGDNSTLLINSAAGAITSGNWAYLEVAFTRNASTGSAEIKVNGTTVAGPTGSLNTGADAIDRIRLVRVQSLGGSDTINIDDLYVKDDVSSFLGDCRVETIRPSAETADQDWTPSTGTDNSANVDDTTTDGDSTYNSAANAGDKDIYDLANLSTTPATIHAVQPTMVARKDDATTRTVACRVKSDASVDGATHTMASGYQVFADVVELDPDGGIAWTAAAVNAAQLEIEVIS